MNFRRSMEAAAAHQQLKGHECYGQKGLIAAKNSILLETLSRATPVATRSYRRPSFWPVDDAVAGVS
jgi:hypothetical protein